MYRRDQASDFRIFKIFVYTASLVLFFGTAFVLYLLYKHIETPVLSLSPISAQQCASTDVQLNLDQNTTIESISTADNKLFIYTKNSKTREVVILDYCTGEVLKKILLQCYS